MKKKNIFILFYFFIEICVVFTGCTGPEADKRHVVPSVVVARTVSKRAKRIVGRVEEGGCDGDFAALLELALLDEKHPKRRHLHVAVQRHIKGAPSERVGSIAVCFLW